MNMLTRCLVTLDSLKWYEHKLNVVRLCECPTVLPVPSPGGLVDGSIKAVAEDSVSRCISLSDKLSL